PPSSSPPPPPRHLHPSPPRRSSDLPRRTSAAELAGPPPAVCRAGRTVPPVQVGRAVGLAPQSPAARPDAPPLHHPGDRPPGRDRDRKSTRLNSSHLVISYGHLVISY